MRTCGWAEVTTGVGLTPPSTRRSGLSHSQADLIMQRENFKLNPNTEQI